MEYELLECGLLAFFLSFFNFVFNSTTIITQSVNGCSNLTDCYTYGGNEKRREGAVVSIILPHSTKPTYNYILRDFVCGIMEYAQH